MGAQFRGRAKMQIQALLTAAVINLKQLAARRPQPQSGMAVVAAMDWAATVSTSLSAWLERMAAAIWSATLHPLLGRNSKRAFQP
jgi:hypothetical protein